METPSRVLEHIAQLREFGAAIVKQADAPPATLRADDCCLVPARVVKQLLNGLADDDLLLVVDRPHVAALAKRVNARPGYSEVPGLARPTVVDPGERAVAEAFAALPKPRAWTPASLDGYAIKRWRTALAWTQMGLAERLGVDKSAVSAWERNEYRPKPDARERLLALMQEHPA